MKSYLIVLFIAAFLMGQDVLTQEVKTRDAKIQVVKTQDAFWRNITDYGKGIQKLASRARISALSEWMFSDAIKSFGFIVDLLQFYMDETQEMVYREFIEQRGWMEELQKDGFIDAALIEAGDVGYSVGEAFSQAQDRDFSFYINAKGEVRYLYYKKDDSISLDLSLTFSGFASHVSNLERSPGSLFLYDRNNNRHSELLGNVEYIPEWIKKKYENASKLRTILTIKDLVIIKELGIENSGMVLIALYPYKIGTASVQLFGLIGVVILTILLLSFVIYFTFQSYEKRGVAAMEEEENADIIDEIDKELYGVGKKEAGPAPDSRSEKKPRDKALKRLEDDGIFIHK